MRRIFADYRASFTELKNIRALTLTAMLMALSVILGYFTIEAGPFLKIGFSSLVNAFVCFLFGPVLGAFYEGALDIVKFVMKPTGPYFPGFTLDAVLAGLIYGTVLYGRPLSFRRALLAEFLVSLICNVFLNTLWISVLYGKAFMVLFPVRLLKNAIQCPIQASLFYLIMRKAIRLGLLRNFVRNREE